MSKKSYIRLIELAKLQYEKTDFVQAVELYTEIAEAALSTNDIANYVEAQNYLLRMYAEMGDKKQINKVRDNIIQVFNDRDLEVTSKTYYCLAQGASYHGDQEQSLEYLEKALAQALLKDDKKDICYAISGLVATYISLDRLDEALKELYNLQIFFQVLDIPDIEFSAQIFNGLILRKKGKLTEALDIFWQAYENIKESKNLYMYISLVLQVGLTYKEIGDKNMARVYLGLVSKLIDPKSLTIKAKALEKELSALKVDEAPQYDIHFNSQKGILKERKLGEVQLRNQFVLMDLLKLFLQNPGEVFSKEELVKKVWKQSYDPRVHDNKIYVTIKRLRQVIEPDFDQPKYIFRAKNGYYLNKSTRTLVN